ncbi:MAG: hypothetical protein K9G46_09120 [Flavobacteriales bacterium]|jgi:uncharacterized protein (TIGR02145 family)|nr:hypothetical protein [Flavobacteriales bacterium]
MSKRLFPVMLALATITFIGCEEEKKDYGADFEAEQTHIGIGQAVNFEDNSIGATSYLWTFEGGDPATSTEKDPEGILYTAAGEFDVTLKIGTAQGDASDTKQGYIVVTQLPGGCEGTTSVTDIDGNNYSVVTIGSQCWMGENLKTSKFRDGSQIAQVTDGEQWKNLSTPAFCFYNNDNSNNDTYGKLYNWFTIEDPRGVCPTGWHVPSDAEYAVLTKYLGSADDVAGGRLKEAGTLHWDAPNEAASNSSGFTGLPAGMRFQEGQFDHMGKNGLFWSSRRESESLAFYLTLTYNSAASYRTYIYKRSGFSCRCVKD